MRKQKLLAALLALVMVVTLLPITALAASTTVTSWKEITDPATITKETEVIIVYHGETAGNKALYGYTAGTTATDQWGVNINSDGTLDYDYLVGEGSSRDLCCTWIVTPVDGGGYTIKSKASGNYYININGTTSANRNDSGDKVVPLSTSPQTLTITATAGGVKIGADVSGTNYYISHNDVASTDTSRWFYVSETGAAIKLFAEVTEEIVTESGKLVDHTKVYPAKRENLSRPFPSGQPSNNYRIPSLITLTNGRLLAAIDARWNQTGDGANLDTIVSVSDNDGTTWTNYFANYFEDSTDSKSVYASAFIDPAMVQDPNTGTIYLLTDIWPAGVDLNTATYRPAANTNGYVTVDNVKRLALYASPIPSVQSSDSNYTHYVGDFVEMAGFGGKLAPVVNKTTGETDYYVDEWYYLYNTTDLTPINCYKYSGSYKSSTQIHANVFFWDAPLHVRATSHLWLVKSTDNGATWSAPQLLNGQVRTGEQTSDKFYGVGPGRGLVTSNGRIMFALYTWNGADRRASVIYSDNGTDWKKSDEVANQTSEATIVEADGRIYMFARHGYTYVSEDGGQTWISKSYWPSTTARLLDSCQIDAITYSKKINGRTAIILAGPTGGSRANGKIYVGLVQDDGSISWSYTYNVTSGAYGYSCLTELQDGTIGLLYEVSGNDVQFVKIPISTLAQGAAVGNKVTATIPLYETYNLTVTGASGVESLAGLEQSIAKVESSSGTSFTFRGMSTGTTEFTCGDYEYTITVSDDSKTIIEVPLEVGNQYTTVVGAASVSYQNGSNVNASISTESVPYDEPMVQLGTDASYDGAVVPMSNALHTATSSGSYWIFSSDLTGETVYLNLRTNGAGVPHATSSTSVTVAAAASPSNTFTLTQVGGSTSVGGMLYFWYNNTSKLRFDRNSSASAPSTSMRIYTKDNTGETADIQILADAGYYRVTNTSQLKSGEQYLIVPNQATNGNNYMLYPSNSSDVYAHVAKLVTDTTHDAYTLTVTGASAGTTDVMVGDTIYRFTVSDAEPTVTKDDVKTLIPNITVEDTDDKHTASEYELADEDITLGTVNGSDGSYEVEVIISGERFRGLYNTENGFDHSFAEGQEANIKVILTYDNGSWTLKDDVDAAFTVSCAYVKASLIVPEDVDAVYDGTNKAEEAGVNGTDAESYTVYYRLDGENEWSETLPEIKDAGTYTVNVKAAKEGVMTLSATDPETLEDSYTVTIEKAEVTIKADDQSKTEGTPDPTLTATVTGKPENGDALVYTVTRTEGETVGTYDITVNVEAEANPNYDITVEGGTMTINAAPVVIPPAIGGETQIPDEEPPLDAEPDGDTNIEDTTPLAPAPDDTDIPDGDTPLDSTPKTGDDSIAIAVLWSIFSLSAVGFVSVMLSMKKAGKHSK